MQDYITVAAARSHMLGMLVFLQAATYPLKTHSVPTINTVRQSEQRVHQNKLRLNNSSSS